MKSSNIRWVKSTCFILLLFFFTACPVSAEKAIPFAALPANFDNDFRFSNTHNLTGKIILTAKIRDYERIIMVDLDKRQITKLIDGPGNNSYPVFSPNGSKIAFTSDRDGNPEIYLANSDGSSPERITTNKGLDDNAAWSPDGGTLYFLSEHVGARKLNTNIFSYDLKTKKVTQITHFKGKNSTPAISPDGRKIAYTTNRYWPGWDVCIFNLDTKKDSCPLSGSTTFCRPDWGGSGSRLAYSSGLFTSIDPYIYNMGDGSSTSLAATSGNDYDLKWSNDEKFIIFASDQKKKQIYNIYAQPVEGNAGSEPDLLIGAPYSLRFPSWHQ